MEKEYSERDAMIKKNADTVVEHHSFISDSLEAATRIGLVALLV